MLELPAPLRDAMAAGGSGISILVLRLGAMGDIVRTMPAVRLVRRALPGAAIHWAAWTPWTILLRDHPAFDSVIALPRSELSRLAGSPASWPALVAATRGLARELRTRHPGVVLDFHGDLRTGLLGRLSGAPVRIGYEGHQQKEGNRMFTTHRVPAGERRRSRIARNLDLVEALGLPVGPMPNAGITMTEAERSEAQAIADAAGVSEQGYAILNPGASRKQAFKRPPARLFAGAVAALLERGVVPIVVCGPGEEADADRVIEAADGAARRAPATSLKVLAALLAGSRLFVGGDSGPMHLACGVDCPVVGLFGPTDPIVNAPWNVPFAALSDPANRYTGIKSQDRTACGFDGLTAEAVGDAIRALLSL